MPAQWFPSETPVLDGVMSGPAYAWAWLYSMISFVGLQARRATASGIFLDLIAADFFGTFLKRRTNESDALFSARIGLEMFREKGTRAGMIAALTDLTGRVPSIFEPANTEDTGGWSVGGVGYGVGGGYGDLQLPYQFFVTSYRPLGVGVASVAGFGDTGGFTGMPGGYGVGAFEYANSSMFVPNVSDQDILNTINDVRPAATIAWTRILDNPVALETVPDPFYSGPGDVVPGATAFWGVRAYSRAAGNANTPAINVRRSSDNATMDINVLSAGALDVATLNAFLASTTGYVTIWYDQTGNGNHMVQATAANQPQIITSGPSSLPTLLFSSASATSMAWAAPTIAQPYSYVSVGIRTGNLGSNSAMIGNGSYHAVMFYGSSNHAVMQAGGTTGASIAETDNSRHSFIGVANAALSTLSVDGTITSAGLTSADTASISSTVWLGQVLPSTWLLTGDMMESGIWPSALTTTQQANLTANQRAYFGF